MRLIVFIKKECYYTTTVGANEGRMKFTSILPSAAQLVRSKCTGTFSMRKRQEIYSLKRGSNALVIAILISSASVEPCPSAVQTTIGNCVLALINCIVTSIE